MSKSPLKWVDLDGHHPMTYRKAVSLVNALNRREGREHWRLPTFFELETALYDDDVRENLRQSPAYWTSGGRSPETVWTIEMGISNKHEFQKDTDYLGIVVLIEVEN